MLSTINIKNFAVIEQLTVEFSTGLNILTGETGAGKSIIVDALMAVLGSRASADLVRDGAKKAVIEGHFQLNEDIQKVLEKSDDFDCEGEELILRREISAKGNSRCFVNDTPVNVGTLKEIGELLADFHGQHDHQSLLKPENHLEILDSTGNYHSALTEYTDAYRKYTAAKSELKELKLLADKSTEAIELYKMQLSEISRTDPKPDEDELLEKELNLLENSERVFFLANEIYDKLYESDNSALNLLSDSINSIKELSGFDSAFSNFTADAESALIAVKEIAKFTKDYADNNDFEPGRPEEIRSRLFELNSIKKKYGSLREVIQKRNELSKKLESIASYSDKIKAAQKELDKLLNSLEILANELFSQREVHSERFSSGLKENLLNLGLKNTVFEVNPKPLQPKDESVLVDNTGCGINSKGSHNYEFFISTNLGESPKPLSSVASGGEISRIMLSIKQLLAGNDKIPIMVFDEIDTGISGKIARKVGIAMKKLGQVHQVIAITHLPQIAALADRNISVSKAEQNGKTTAVANILTNENKFVEIAKMISGEEVTEFSIESAKQLAIFNSEV
jgi:DNA repair protein RecN (Recombination protein N)